jgi:hypothetical protein
MRREHKIRWRWGWGRTASGLAVADRTVTSASPPGRRAADALGLTHACGLLTRHKRGFLTARARGETMAARSCTIHVEGYEAYRVGAGQDKHQVLNSLRVVVRRSDRFSNSFSNSLDKQPGKPYAARRPTPKLKASCWGAGQ